MDKAVRVRFAPSPTGYLHVGGARTALFNWLLARQTGGVFVLRIEDTDRNRSSDDMVEAILDGMKWLGLEWDEGPYHQADGFARHQEDVAKLLESGKAYRCFCPPDEIQAKRDAAEAAGGPGSYRYDRKCSTIAADESSGRAENGEPFTVRFLVPDGTTEWDDAVHGSTRYENEDIEDFIILRSDATPVYNMAVVSDDASMEITHVIRGDDHLSNTPKQILLYRALGVSEPIFGHLPMILGPDGKRLSKRHGATAVGEYQNSGILPGALLNFLALLGWNPGDDQEVMMEHELISRFSLERVNRKSAIFDPEKLEWMNGQHIMNTPAHDLVNLITPDLLATGITDRADLESRADWFADVVELLKPRSRTTMAIAEQIGMFLEAPSDYDAGAVAKQWKDASGSIEKLDATRKTLDAIEDWAPESIEAALRATAESLGVGFGKLVQPLRLALTGGLASPGIDQMVFLLEREGSVRRIDRAIKFLEKNGATVV